MHVIVVVMTSMADIKLWWPGVYSAKNNGGLCPFKVTVVEFRRQYSFFVVSNAKSKGTVKHNITLDVRNK